MKKCVVITGGSDGIGRAAVERFAADGCQVYFSFLNSEKKARELCSKCENVTAVRADVSDSATAAELIKKAYEKEGHIDVLVCNAGISSTGMLSDLTSEEWNRVFSVNTTGVFNTVAPAYKIMVGQKNGRIITVSSIWGQTGGSCEVIYSASKAAVIGFSKALAKELAPSGITVNCVAPGVIDTRMNNNLNETEKTTLAEEIPLLRFGTPAEVAGVIHFLASEDASYITGQVISPNGGLYI